MLVTFRCGLWLGRAARLRIWRGVPRRLLLLLAVGCDRKLDDRRVLVWLGAACSRMGLRAGKWVQVQFETSPACEAIGQDLRYFLGPEQQQTRCKLLCLASKHKSTCSAQRFGRLCDVLNQKKQSLADSCADSAAGSASRVEAGCRADTTLAWVTVLQDNSTLGTSFAGHLACLLADAPQISAETGKLCT